MKPFHINNTIPFIIFSFFLILFLSFSSQRNESEEYYYYAFEEKIIIHQVADKILVKKKSTLTKSNFEESVRMIFGEINTHWFNNNICKIELKNLRNKQEKCNTLLSDNEIVSVRNIYQTFDGLEFGFSDKIMVKYKDNITLSEQDEIENKYQLKKSKSTRIYNSYSVSKNDDILDIANQLFETGKFIFAYPDIICRAELFQTTPNDTYFGYQIAFHNTGQTINDGHTGTADADIDAPEAWDISTGRNNIIIAVIDQGVTADHGDLPNSRQVRLEGSNFGLGDEDDPSPLSGYDYNHGNACAGVIGATMNNNEGIAGIAPGCRIMPVRWDSTSSNSDIIDAIEFAVDNGADILSNSWGYPTSTRNYIPAMVTAIENAINDGIVVVFAAGNSARHFGVDDDGFVAFPANADVDYLLTVGASDRYDSQADYSPTSSLIDIVAPSHRAYPPEAYYPSEGGIDGETFEMWTIDIPGSSGYNTWPASEIHPPSTNETLPNSGTRYLSYTGRFGGTSHACPVVAGVVALLLSENTLITPEQVFEILTETADEIGGYTYIDGRSDETGFGRVNAYEALQSCPSSEFTDQTVTTNTTIVACDILIQNVSVEDNSTLSIEARNETTINGPFSAELGSVLEIKN